MGARTRPPPGAGPDALGNAVYVGLADENGYSHEGRLVFMDNSLDAETGTIYARALLTNPDGHFVPGLFARVKLIGNDHYQAVLINDSAIGTDQTMRYVLLLGPDNKVEYRPVELGPHGRWAARGAIRTEAWRHHRRQRPDARATRHAGEPAADCDG